MKRAKFRLDGDADEDDNKTGDLDVTGTITIDGNGARIDGRAVDRIFDVQADARLKLEHVRLVNGSPEENASGGAIRSAGELTVKRSIISDSTVQGDGASGGAIFNDGGKLKVSRSALVGNASVRAGGAIEANAGTTTVVRSTLDRNRTGDNPGNGGGLHLTGAGTVHIDDSYVVRNRAAAEGGGLWNSATGTMTVTDTRIRRNRAPVGPNVFNDGGTFTVGGNQVPVGG